MSSFVKGMAFSIAVLTLAVGLVGLSAMTIHRLAAAPASLTSWIDEGKDGTASVTGCVVRGPIGQGGVGYYWACTADVATEAGTLTGVGFEGELTPGDQGKLVAVEDNDGEWRRNVAHPYWFLDYLIGIYLAIFVLFASVMQYFYYRELKDEESGGSTDSKTGENSVDMPVRHHELLKSNRDRGKLSAILGLSLVALASFTGWLAFDLRVGSFWDPAYVVCGAIFVLGTLIVIYSLRLKAVLDEVTFFVESDGLRVLTSDGRGSLLAWSMLERVVFEQARTMQFQKAVSVQVVSSPSKRDELHAWIRTYFRAVRAKHGYELSPGMQRTAAAKFSKLIEQHCPGITRWPRREIRRWGFGLFALVDRFSGTKER